MYTKIYKFYRCHSQVALDIDSLFIFIVNRSHAPQENERESVREAKTLYDDKKSNLKVKRAKSEKKSS